MDRHWGAVCRSSCPCVPRFIVPTLAFGPSRQSSSAIREIPTGHRNPANAYDAVGGFRLPPPTALRNSADRLVIPSAQKFRRTHWANAAKLDQASSRQRWAWSDQNVSEPTAFASDRCRSSPTHRNPGDLSAQGASDARRTKRKRGREQPARVRPACRGTCMSTLGQTADHPAI